MYYDIKLLTPGYTGNRTLRRTEVLSTDKDVTLNHGGLFIKF